MTLLRFDGAIAGAGSSSGVRIVLGRWSSSPFGAFADVMVQDAAGHRVLLAPTRQVADFVAQTYVFDEVVVGPVEVHEAPDLGDEGRGSDGWVLRAGDHLRVRLALGPRMPLGHLLRLVPRSLATSPRWATLVDPVARVAMKGVRTRGTALAGRREWYGATDLRRVAGLSGSWRGSDLGVLADVDPPCTFGFSSTPTTPCLTTVTTTVQLFEGWD